MDKNEMMKKVKTNLQLDTVDYDLKILDTIQAVCDYCNLSWHRIPDELESFVRRKVQGILEFEESNAGGYTPPVASISKGDVRVSFAQSSDNSWVTITELNVRDKQWLNRYRNLRWPYEP